VRPRNTLLVLLILAALGAYVYWVELPEEARKVEEARLLAFDEEDVTGVTLAYPDRTITLAKDADGHWRLTAPIEDAADDVAAKNLVSAIATAKVERSLEDVGDKLASYGLAEPVVTVSLALKGDATVPPLKVGETTAVGFSSYVQRGDDPTVHITTASFQSGMQKQVADLRDKRLVTFEDQDVRAIELARPEGTVVLERVGDGDAWRVTAPAEHPADASEVRALLASARGIRVMDFVTDEAGADLAPYGLDGPRLVLAVRTGADGAEQRLLLGGPHEDAKKNALYAKRAERPTVATVASYALKNLDKSLATLRDKTVLAYEKPRAATIAVTRKDGAGFTLVKRGETWHLEDAGAGKERGPTISRFVDDVHGFKGNEIAAEGTGDPAAFGLDQPDLAIAVRDAEGETIGTIVAVRGAAGGDENVATAYAMAAGAAIVYALKPYVFDRLDKKAADFRDQPPPAPEPAAPEPAAEAGAVEPAAPAPAPEPPAAP